MEFEKYRLSQLLTIKNGRDYKSLGQGSVPVFGSGGYMCSVDSYLYDRPSVLLPRKGTLSNIQYYDKGPFWTVDTCYYTIVDKNLVNSYYIYRYLRNLNLSGLDTGASIPSMTQKTYNGIKILLPNLSIQHRIASILSTYDSLIENNTKRIRLLEKMAENLYKEWFVRFRFPGHENVEMENGLPKGWKMTNLFDVAGVTYGFAFKSNKFCDNAELNPVVRIRDIQENHTNTYTDEQCEDKYLIGKNAILIGMDGIFHMCLWNGERAYMNQRVVMLNSKEKGVCNYLLYLAIRPQIKYWEQVISGTTVAHLGDKHLRKVKVLLPEKAILEKANSIISRAMDEKNILQHQNSLLARQRDLLLPRLMSGKLEVKEELLE
jgi:type I restriction enzyme S subunit